MGTKYTKSISVGMKIHSWTVTGSPTASQHGAKVKVRCECGTETEVYVYNLLKNKTKQCRSCTLGNSATLNSLSNATQRRAIGYGAAYNVSPTTISESFSLQGGTCAITGQALSLGNAATVRLDNSKGFDPSNTMIVSKDIKNTLTALSLDAKSFIGLCQSVAQVNPNPLPSKKNITVQEFFDRRSNNVSKR